MPEVMFRRYLRAWWSAAWAPAWDLFGWLGVAVGGVLWLWNKRWPENYKWSAQSIGITPEAAMSDLVWVLPMVAGVLLLAYRFLRVPFEMHLVLERRIDQLTKQPFPFASTVPDVSIGESVIQLRLLVLNRQSDAALSLGISLRIDEPQEDGTVRENWVSQAELGHFNLAVPPHTTSDGVVTFVRHYKGRAHLVVFDMVSRRSTPAFPIPGTFPGDIRLRATTYSTFTKSEAETVELQTLL